MTRLVRSDSFFGKVQRGLGSGYLDALGKPTEAVESAIFRCLANDPRLNAQDEDRDLYYARLILARGIDDAPVRKILTENPDHGQSHSTRDWLPLGVLGLLARAGRPGAIEAVRDYVKWGVWWPDAVFALGKTGHTAAWDGLDAVLLARFGSDARNELAEGRATSAEPWRTWRKTGPLSSVLVKDPSPADPTPDLLSLPTTTLLEKVQGRGPLKPDPAAAVLVDRIKSGSVVDRDAIDAAMNGDNLGLAARAIQVLGVIGDPSIVEPGTRLLTRLGRFGSGNARFKISVLRGFEGLPAPVALDIARAWRDKTDFREVIATRLLERHATDEDLVWVLERIRWAARTHRDLFAYARILHRYPGRGPFEGFEDIYRRYVPTCCRAHLIDAMSVTDPDFGSTLAFECLFDCEARSRESAARTVDLAVPGAIRRVKELRADALEEDEARSAASARFS